jgi:uncharacterized membrane protein YedE/YeeE
VTALIAVVSADNLAGGIASAAFIAYLSSLTNVSYSATQYALFSSMMLLLPKWWRAFRATTSTPLATPVLCVHRLAGPAGAAAGGLASRPNRPQRLIHKRKQL